MAKEETKKEIPSTMPKTVEEFDAVVEGFKKNFPATYEVRKKELEAQRAMYY